MNGSESCGFFPFHSSGRVLTYFGRVGTVGMERGYSWSFVPFQAVRVHTVNFQATEQPTRTGINPTDFCGGTAQHDPKTVVPSRGQRVLLTQIMNFHANILQGKPQSRRCEPSKSHLRAKSRSYDIAIAARRRLLKFRCTSVPRICHKYIARVSFPAPSFPSYASWSGYGRIAWLLPRASPLPPTYAPSHALYAISCHLMYTHTPMVLQQMSQHSQHQLTARFRVPSGPFGLA